MPDDDSYGNYEIDRAKARHVSPYSVEKASMVYRLPVSANYQLLDEIEQQLAEAGYSPLFNEWLDDNWQHLEVVAFNPLDHWKSAYRSRGTSIPARFWADVLETYLKVHKVTPGAIELWNWAMSGHRRDRYIEQALSFWSIHARDNVLYFKQSSHNYESFRKFFRRSIGTKPETKHNINFIRKSAGTFHP